MLKKITDLIFHRHSDYDMYYDEDDHPGGGSIYMVPPQSENVSEQLDKLDIEDIEEYLRTKKLNRIKDKMK